MNLVITIILIIYIVLAASTIRILVIASWKEDLLFTDFKAYKTLPSDTVMFFSFKKFKHHIKY